MGKKNDALLTYLEDNARFADLFNYSYFGGDAGGKAAGTQGSVRSICGGSG